MKNIRNFGYMATMLVLTNDVNFVEDGIELESETVYNKYFEAIDMRRGSSLTLHTHTCTDSIPDLQ